MTTEYGVRYANGEEQWESEREFWPTVHRFAQWFDLDLIKRERASGDRIEASEEKRNGLRERANQKHVQYLAAVKKSLDAEAEKDSAYLAWADALDDLKLEETR